MPGDNDRSIDLYDSDMGPLGGDGVTGSSVGLDKGGSGQDHHVVHGKDRHFSWDTDKDGNVSGVHGRSAGETNKHDKPW